jgi:hypothetical protein
MSHESVQGTSHCQQRHSRRKEDKDSIHCHHIGIEEPIVKSIVFLSKPGLLRSEDLSLKMG